MSPTPALPVKGVGSPGSGAGQSDVPFIVPAAASHIRGLLDRMREIIRVRRDSIRPEDACVDRARRFILHHDKRHPLDLGAPVVAALRTHLAVQRNVAPATRNQAKSVVPFPYREVLGVQLRWLGESVAAESSAGCRSC